MHSCPQAPQAPQSPDATDVKPFGMPLGSAWLVLSYPGHGRLADGAVRVRAALKAVETFHGVQNDAAAHIRSSCRAAKSPTEGGGRFHRGGGQGGVRLCRASAATSGPPEEPNILARVRTFPNALTWAKCLDRLAAR